jgi:hypothetical protein
MQDLRILIRFLSVYQSFNLTLVGIQCLLHLGLLFLKCMANSAFHSLKCNLTIRYQMEEEF